MPGLWDGIKRSLSDWFSKAEEKADGLAKEAVDRVEEIAKVGKIKLDILQIKREVEKRFAELGGIVYQLIVDEGIKNVENNEKIKSVIEEIKRLEEKLRNKEEEYKRIKGGIKEKTESKDTGTDSGI